MSNKITYVCIALIAAGCSTPLGKFNKQKDVVTGISQNIDKNKEWVNWPDYQWRIWKNKPEIKWKNKVHEVLEGHKKYAPLPAMEDLCLYHHKTIEKQEKQNNFYEKLL